MEKLKKQKTKGFGKDIYLLGEGEDGTYYWLEAPSWDCNWYWGFGYIESYTRNKNPKASSDINGHQHWNSSVVGPGNHKDNGYCHNPFESKLFAKTTFTEEEGWKLGELFSQFYHWKEHAEMIISGGGHITSLNPAWYKGKKNYYKTEAEKINKEIIPGITSEIIKILSPKEI